jgi:NAD(P)-dependent dehydrogenase (short-subunit alcohol dehydrogenase family)
MPRMTAAYLDAQPHLLDKWSSLNPLGRIGRPDELRGVIAWLASDASTFCTGSEYVDPLPPFVVILILIFFLTAFWSVEDTTRGSGK